MNNLIYTPLANFAAQRGITRARAYQLKSKLHLIDLPLYADDNGKRIPVMKDGKHFYQTHVVQQRDAVQSELDIINLAITNCNGCDLKRLQSMKKEIENILK